MKLWEKYAESFRTNAKKTAFCIDSQFYTYLEFTEYISGSQRALLSFSGFEKNAPVGVICRDSIETFAAIFAIWFSGSQFVPLNPLHPVPFNLEKIELAGIPILFDSEVAQDSNDWPVPVLKPENLKSTEPISIIQEQSRAYILFTSGSTGKPKGVPISPDAMNAFIEGFLEIYPDLTSNDRFLQTYDLTSDAAFTGYLIPLLLGASVYTIPSGGIKYLSIVKLLQERQITWTQFTPSVLNYLRPYLEKISFNELKHSHFGGEALPLDLVSEWAECVPNAEISNIYGPTETTITCTIHRTEIGELSEKVHNGVISIGKPLKNVKILILDDNNQIVAQGEKGELCIGGIQVMEGYLANSGNEDSIFFRPDENGNPERYYRSGDLVFQDDEGFLFFCGRKDDQLKISGYRIEPAEIEVAISRVTNGLKSKAFGFRNKGGTESIVVFMEARDISSESLKDNLRTILPAPLIPEKIICISQFPLNSNGKIDKIRLFESHSKLIYD